METPRTHRALIKALGGPIKLARKLGIPHPMPTTVHWPARGIPSRYWHRIAELAAEVELAVTARDLEEMPIAPEKTKVAA